MNGRAVAVQGGLALVALVAAYLTWQRQPELQAGHAFVLDITRNELESIRFEDEEKKIWVELLRGKDQFGSFVTLHLSAREEPALPGKEPRQIPERVVRGNESAHKLLERFTPLLASRALGVLDAAKLKDLGLDASKKRLAVATRAGRRSFTVAPAPPGGTDPYLRDSGDGRVFVVGRQLLTDLQAAHTSLVERRLHGFRADEVDRVVVTTASNKREYRASRSDDGRGLRLAPASAPDSPDEAARAWHDRVWLLWPAEILGRDETPAEGTPERRLRVEYVGRGKSLGWLELGECASPAANVSAPGAAPKPTAYARSEFTLGWVKLSGDPQPILEDAAKL